MNEEHPMKGSRLAAVDRIINPCAIKGCTNKVINTESLFLAKQLIGNKTPAKQRDIFRDTLIAKKYGKGEVRTYWLGNKQNSSTSPGSNPGPTT